jgi:phage tail tape-measure protein
MLRGSTKLGFVPERTSVTCVIHQGHLRASGCSGHVRVVAGADLRGNARRRAAFWSKERPTSTTSSAKMGRRGRWCSPRARIGRRSSAGGSTAMAGGGDGVALVERAAAGVLRAPGLHGSTWSGAVKVPRGLRRMETRRRR